MSFVRIRVLVFFLLFSAAAAVAETVSLSLEEAVGRALDQSLGLKKDAIDLSRAEYSADRLWAEIFPSFSLRAGLTFLPGTPLFTEPGFSFKGESQSYNLNFGLSLSLNPSLRSSMKRIELAYRTELLDYEDAKKQLEIQVIKSFLSLINGKEYLEYLRESLELAEQTLEKDLVSRENGFLSELALLNSRLGAETARYNLSNAEASYENTLGEFLALLGMEADTELTLTGTIEIAPLNLDPGQLILEHLPKRPDIVRQRQAIERLELSKNITSLTNRSPTLELGASWQGGSSASGSTGKGLGDPFADNLSGSLSLRIPIDAWIPGTKQHQDIGGADAEVEKAKLDLRNTEISAQNEIRSIISGLRNIWENLEIARMREEIARRTVEASEEGFRNGTVESRDLEDTRNKLTDARQQRLQGVLSYQSLLLDLAAALNVDWKTLTKPAN